MAQWRPSFTNEEFCQRYRLTRQAFDKLRMVLQSSISKTAKAEHMSWLGELEWAAHGRTYVPTLVFYL